MEANQRSTLITLFNQTKKAHGAFEELHGADDDWPAWYADYLIDELESITNAPIEQEALKQLLRNMQAAFEQIGEDTHWAEFYADYLIEHEWS